ncbi:MAG: hypothetical protein M3Q37_09010 [Gemmatimonadota bacterium]|nr:hypothetical protein [Gemmatimonadota bacterium]
MARPWRVVARDTVTLEFMAGPRRLKHGDTLYGLDGRRVWYRGQLDSLREALSWPADRRLQFVCTQRITYWLQFRRDDGRRAGSNPL